MKKFVFAAICTFTLAGFVLAEDITAVIVKVDGKTVTYYKTKAAAGKGGKGGGGKGGGFGKAEKDGDPIKGTVIDKVAVLKGAFDPDTKAFKDGDAIEGGLTSDTFKNASDDAPVTVTLTIADDGADKGKITKIVTKGGGGKGGKKKGG
jgi:hypothetical protein